ncbi:MAG: GNAT family N-acetyltransferase [Candidatus Eremiobacterota bacterium]
MIRLARPQDAPFIRELASSSILSSLPPSRSVDPEQAAAYVRSAYDDLEEVLRTDRNLLLLIAEDEARQPIGYLMVELDHVEPSTGEKQAFIVDLAVVPDRRGRFSTNKLVRKACQLCRARGLKYLVGMVSVNNQRTLDLSRHLDFEVERVQIVRRL